jgi:hypothetical protein
MRGIQVKVHQEANHSPSLRRKPGVTIAKRVDILDPSFRSWKIKRKVTSRVPLLWLVLSNKILRIQNVSLLLRFLMVVLMTSGSLILLLHFIYSLIRIGLVLMIQSMVVSSWWATACKIVIPQKYIYI